MEIIDMAKESNHRSFVQRVFGICATRKAEPGCWRFAGGTLVVDLARAPELARPGGALRVEKSRGLPSRVLIFRDEDGRLHALENRCSHAGRRLDPNGHAKQVECCSLGKSHFDCEGHVVGGRARNALRVYSAEEQDGRLLVHV